MTTAAEKHLIRSESDGQSVDYVFDRMRSAILSGRIAPGEEIPLEKAARELSVSRTPVREALRMLRQEGLVKLPPNRRPVVANLTAEDFEDLYVLRLPLESAAIALTVPRLRPEDIAALEGLRAQMEHFADEQDVDRWEVPHRAFQALLVSRAGGRMSELLGALSDHSERYRRLIIRRDPETWDLLKQDHRHLVDAVKSGDGEAVASLRVSHLMRTASRLIPLLDADYSFDVLLDLYQRTSESSRHGVTRDERSP